MKVVQPSDVLKMCADCGSSGWFPSEVATQLQIPREQLYEHTLSLLRLGLIESFDWVKGRGQGFRITDFGKSQVGKSLKTVSSNPQKSDTSTANKSIAEIQKKESRFYDSDKFLKPYVTPLLIIVCVLVFFAGLLISSRTNSGFKFLAGKDVESSLKTGASFSLFFLEGQWWRVITSCFVHFGIIHLLVNAYALHALGSFSEMIWGRKRYFFIFIISGIAGSLASMAVQPNAVSAGASGGIWGIMLSLLAWYLVNRSELAEDIAKRFSDSLINAIILNAIVSFVPGIDWVAHFAGGATGFIVAILLDRIRPGNTWRTVIALLSLALLSFAGIALVQWQIRNSSQWATMRLMSQIRQNIQNESIDNQLNFVKTINGDAIGSIHQEGVLAAISNSQARLSNVEKKTGLLGKQIKAMLSSIQSFSPKAGQEKEYQQIREYLTAASDYMSKAEQYSKPPIHPQKWTSLSDDVKKLKELYKAMTFLENDNMPQ